jgi:hypothetical protein
MDAVELRDNGTYHQEQMVLNPSVGDFEPGSTVIYAVRLVGHNHPAFRSCIVELRLIRGTKQTGLSAGGDDDATLPEPDSNPWIANFIEAKTDRGRHTGKLTVAPGETGDKRLLPSAWW